MSNKVWVYIDHYKDQVIPSSWEAVGVGHSLAEKLGGGVTALVLGKGVESLAQEAIHYGADEVLLADDDSLEDYRPEPYTAVIAGQASQVAPEVILFPTTTRGRELAGMNAVDLNTGVLVDVVDLDVKEARLVATRPVYAGKLLSKTVCKTNPQIVTLRVRAFAKPERDLSRTGNITRIPAVMVGDAITTKIAGYTKAEGGTSLADSAVIVSGGHGVANNPTLTPPAGMGEKDAEVWRAQQGFKLVGELANVLGGAMGYVLFLLGDNANAERFLLRAVQGNPGYAPAHLHLGMNHLMRGEDSSALEQLNLAVTLAPGTPVADQSQRLLQRYFP